MNVLDINQLPPELLKKAAILRNCTRNIFVVLCNCKRPQSAIQVAGHVGQSRAYVNMRLNILVDQKLIKFKKGKHGTKLFSVVK
jgi:hypothetical protein